MELLKSVVNIRIIELQKSLEELHNWFMDLYTLIIELKHGLRELDSLNDGAS